MDSKLRKLAAGAIRGLRDENDSLSKENERLNSAIKLTFQLYKQGSVSAENLEAVFDDLSEKTKPELDVLEKAAELHVDSGVFNFGNLSERPDLDGVDPLTRLLLEEY